MKTWWIPVLVLMVVATFPRVAFSQERFDVDLRALPSDVDSEAIREIDGMRYSSGSRKLIWQSEARMSTGIRDRLLDMSSDSAWRTAVNGLYELAKPTLETNGQWENPDFRVVAGPDGTLQFLYANHHPLADLLLALGDACNLNLILPPGLTGEVSANLERAPTMLALRLILRAHGYTIFEEPNPLDDDAPILLVVPLVPASDDARQSRVFHVPDGLDLLGIFDGFVQLATRDGKIAPNRQSRMIVVHDTLPALDRMTRYLDLVREAVAEMAK